MLESGSVNKWNWVFWAAFFAFVCSANPTVNGQSDKKKKKPELPEMETVTLVSKDRVILKAEYFGGIHKKSTVPVVLLHDFDGGRDALIPLAKYLQKKFGHAVLVPDLRGHGDSTSIEGVSEPIDRKKFKKMQLASMFEDFEACKRFLMKKNNLGELNIDLLSVVAIGSTSIQTINWCNTDWSWPPLGGLKQGQDVKALVLVAPLKRFKSLNLANEIKKPLMTGKGLPPLPLLITWPSENKTAAKDAKSIYDSLRKSRPEAKGKVGDEEWWQNETLFKVPRGRDGGKGMEFVKKQMSGICNDVGLFLENKVVAVKDDHRWQNRSKDTEIPGAETDETDDSDDDG